MKSQIKLPVLSQLSIRNYSLYPGTSNRGVDLDFPAGVTVLAGINGVGKTTLLNLLMRMLLGPVDRGKSDRDLSRITQRELVVLKRFSFFSDRVPEELGDKATATLEFSIGDRRISVTRLLKSMELKVAKINGRHLQDLTEVRFADEMARLCGLATRYDFHVVVRYLQFFTEERQPILWSAATQFEFFKILFLDRKLATATNEAFAAIHRLDTAYRNRLNLLNKREDRLKESRAAVQAAAAQNTGSLAAQVDEAKAAWEQANAEYVKHKRSAEELQEEVKRLDAEFNQAEATLADLEEQLQHADAAFIAQALPTMDDKAKFLMAGLGSGHGCFVCGHRQSGQLQTVAKALKGGNCFVCHHPISGRGKGAKVESIAAAQVRQLEQKYERVKATATAIESRREAVYRQVNPALEALRQASSRNAAAALAFGTLQAQLPSAPEAANALDAELNAERDALNVLDADRKKQAEIYRDLVRQGRVQIEVFKETLRTKLAAYAEAFLLERVEVQFGAQDKVKIATGAGQVGMPSFSIRMTSSTHEIPKERLTSENVSESQKEFLDLAFRMTLLDMVCSDGATTLVIETPEASLDSWFMLRAAELMRQFAPASADRVRNLIATSNLNGTAMIPALLGRVGKDGRPRRHAKTTGAQLVDLLKVTAKSNTLKDEAARTLLEQELERFE